MRIWILVLLGGAAAAQGRARTVEQILADHRRALGGGAAKVTSLRAVSEIRVGQARPVSGVTSVWQLPAGWRRVFPAPRIGDRRFEYFTRDGAYIFKGPHFERYRPQQSSTRGGYYLMKSMADPFPLLRLRPGRLTVGSAPGFEVLVSKPDRHGVRAVYLLDPGSHQLVNLRCTAGEQEFVNVTFHKHRMVGGVSLPHDITISVVSLRQDPARRRLLPRKTVWHESVTKWRVGAGVGAVSLVAPGLGSGGGGGFSRRTFASGPNPREIAVGDLDRDGKPDVAVACWGGVYVHFGGDEKTPKRIPLGKGQHRGLAIEDFDRDGRAELITTSDVEPSETVFLLTFGKDRKVARRRTVFGAPLFTWELGLHDFDRDGLADIVATGFASKKVEVKFASGTGGVRPLGTYRDLDEEKKGRSGFGHAVGDLDGDGLLDLAVADGKSLAIFLGMISLGFKPMPKIDLPRPVDVVFVDLNGDGHQDLLVANETIRDDHLDLAVLLNDGKGELKGEVLRAGVRAQAVATGDFNGDGHPDAAVASFQSGEVSVLFGDGNGGFSKPAFLRSGRGTCQLAVADLNGDLRDDIAAANRLDDTITLLVNTSRSKGVLRAPPPRARECATFTGPKFRLQGLSDPYTFVTEFRLPVEITDPSGITFLGGDASYSQFVLVSDDLPFLYRATLDRIGKRLLVSPPIPIEGVPQRPDFETVAYDRWSGNLFVGLEGGKLLRTTLFGHKLGMVRTPVQAGNNDGLEAMALRRRKDGTPVLYLFRERIGRTLMWPPVHVVGLKEDPFRVEPRMQPIRLPTYTPDQAGAAVVGDRLYVVCRFVRQILEVRFESDGFGREFKMASYAKLTTEELGLVNRSRFGMAEGIAFDAEKDLFLLLDNNGETIGHAGENRGREGRLLWFRNRGAKPAARPVPRRVVVDHIFIPKGMHAEARARECYRRLREGEDFEKLAARFHERSSAMPQVLVVVKPPAKPGLGERTPKDLPVALARLLFALEVEEPGLCEHHAKESPLGWHIVRRKE